MEELERRISQDPRDAGYTDIRSLPDRGPRIKINPFRLILADAMNECSAEDIVWALDQAYNAEGVNNTLWLLCEGIAGRVDGIVSPAMSLISGAEQYVVTRIIK
jgi:hypothetical protein